VWLIVAKGMQQVFVDGNSVLMLKFQALHLTVVNSINATDVIDINR